MVLIFDDNEFRRKELKRALRDTEINFKIDTYENWEYLTKPILTVFIMPKPSEIDYLVRSINSQGTVAVSLLILPIIFCAASRISERMAWASAAV